MPTYKPKVGFVFTTKERIDYTLRSLRSIDTESGFDLIWVDGSETPEAKALPRSAKLCNCRLAEVHSGVKGGPDKAVRLGLRRLLELKYDYCGLLENDIELKAGWYAKLMELFQLGQEDGLRVGSVTVRTVDSRILMYRPRYAILWTMGAGMVLFTKEAARIILATYGLVYARKLSRFYNKRFQEDLKSVWEIWRDMPDLRITSDCSWAMHLYRYGLSSLGTLPCMALEMDFDLKTTFRTFYIENDSAEISEIDKQRFNQLVKLTEDASRVSTLKRNMMLIMDYVRSLILWSVIQNKYIRYILHPRTLIKSLYYRVKVFICKK